MTIGKGGAFVFGGALASTGRWITPRTRPRCHGCGRDRIGRGDERLGRRPACRRIGR
jgi:hypothetical protein